nr:lytic murein transglycosylase [Ferrimonas aestuarii]
MRTTIGALLLCIAAGAQGAQEPDQKQQFMQYVEGLKQEAATHAIKPEVIDAAFANVKLYQRAIKADRNQPEFKKTLDTYLPQAVPDWKVAKAKRLLDENRELLDKVGQAYGVQPRFIVALWGVETNFGNYTGNFSVVGATASLAFEGRREAFFKEQLFAALTILNEGHIQPENMKGSWAGAMGQCQFMPTSFLAYAQDFDGDGKKDIWGNKADVFASTANYLKQVGWDDDLTWARQVTLTAELAEELKGLKVKKSLAEWQALGVRRMDGSALPTRDIQASLVQPDDAHGRSYLAYGNYDALMRWNRSHYFVAAVGHLADRIKFSN